MKILVVDDEELLVKGIRFNLQKDGYEVLTGSNGAEAIELARSADVSLIILDVMMPEIDGLTACEKYEVEVTVKQIAVFLSAAGYYSHISRVKALPYYFGYDLACVGRIGTGL